MRLPCAAARCAALALVVLLTGCAYHAPTRAPAPEDVADITGRALVGEWQLRVTQQMQASGRTDPAALAQLPALRSPAVLRPGRIVFVVNDIDAQHAERDGYDVCGLLVGRRDVAGESWYVFVVGAVQRRGYRSIGVADLRAVALRARGEEVVWATGDADRAALQRYRAASDPTATVQFPADADRFRLISCEPGVCVEEAASGTRWAVYFPPITR